MPTYFNYVEREADSYVNWADVGRDMSNTIDDIQRVREEKKGLIEKTYREDLKFIQDNPSGEHETMNSWSLGVAQSSAEMMRLQNTMLKQGKLSLPNYLTFRQNITDSVEKIYTVNSQLQEAFKEVNDRSKADTNQQLERETKVLLEKYGKLQDTEAYINPLNGTIYLGLTEIVEEDGKSVKRLKKGDGTYLSPDQLQAAAVQKFDKFDERPVLKTFVDGLGNVNEQIRQIGGEALAGKILSITDVTYDRIIEIADSLPEGQKLTPAKMDQLKKYAKNFEEAETKYIQGVLKNEYNACSLMTENGIDKDGKTYNIVFNKADQKSEYDIYVDKTDSKFTPMITEKQNLALTDYLRGQLRVMYDRKVEQASISEPVKQKEPAPNYPQPNAAAYAKMGKKEKASEYGSLLGKLYGLPYEDKEGTLTTIRNLTDGGSANFGVDENNDTYILMENAEGNKRERIYYTKNGKPVPINTFVEQAASFLSGFEDIREDLKYLRDAANKESRGGVLNTDFGSGSNRSTSAWTDKSTLMIRISELEDKQGNSVFGLEEDEEIELEEKKILLDKIEYRGNQGGTQGGGGGSGVPGGNSRGG